MGLCLATQQEWTAAARDAAAGRWPSALRQPGAYLGIVQHDDGTVRVAGDRAGTVPLYWRTVGKAVLWATAATPLAAYTDRAPAPAALLAPLAVRGLDASTHSLFPGIHRVPPGRCLILTPGRPPHTEPVPAADAELTFTDGAEQLNTALTDAVVRRTRRFDPLSADLSGGIDSSTLTVLAARTAPHPILATTYTDPDLDRQDDLDHARRIAAAVPGIDHRVVRGGHGVLHFSGLDDPATLPHTDLPALTLGLLAIKDAQLAPALAAGSAAHLTGRGGDDVLDAPAAAALDLHLAGHPAQALRHLAALARTWRIPAHRVLRQAATTLRTPYPRALAELAAHLRGPAPIDAALRAHLPLSWCSTLPGAAWLTPTGRTALADLVADHADTAQAGTAPGRHAQRTALEMMGAGHAEYAEIARQRWNLDIHAPYLDTPVVDACHAVPAWQRRRPGDLKPLARAAFTGTVPDTVLHRRTKTAFTSSLYAGIRANAPTLHRILETSQLTAAGLLDADRARAALAAAVRGETVPLHGLHTLIATELWLAALPPRTHWWESTDQPARQEAHA
ncbi:asparagine synthase-related protein [Kitasatospora sp. NPDC088783]|uniref:asparagine synthase-related protein n=1 Tax=Kitasatospora sp. NPDC088783 TaxID=3364077 RepID=UPI0037F71098